MQTGAIDHRRSFSRLLKRAGVKPTRQRDAVARHLFVGDRHVTAEQLLAELQAAGERISLATVYNTLRFFKTAGLVRELAVSGARAYFDTNVSDHHHFFVETSSEVHDIRAGEVRIGAVPPAPDGYEIAYVDVLVRLVPKRAAG